MNALEMWEMEGIASTYSFKIKQQKSADWITQEVVKYLYVVSK